MKYEPETACTVFLLVVALFASAPAAQAQIVWTPREGWRRSAGTATGKGAANFDRAFTLYVEGRYRKAAGRLKKVVRVAGEPLKEDARVLFAECRLGLKDYRGAFWAFETFARNYPNSRHIDRALQGQLEIARALLSGGKIRLLGLRIWTAYGIGEKVVDSIISRRPLSDYAAQAQIALARSYFRRRLYIESASTYRQYLELFPNGPDAREALLGVGRSLLFDAGGPGYNPQPYYWASSLATDLSRQYPGTGEAEAARELDLTASAALAEHHFRVAKWYLKKRKVDAALLYLAKVTREHPKTEWAGKAAALMETLTGTAGENDGP